jgi:hypothetical protein
LTEVAPKAAATALQKDFEPIVNHPQVSTENILVGFGRYEELFHNQKTVASKDAFSIMSVAGSTLVIPGENVCECMWTKKRVKTRCMDFILFFKISMARRSIRCYLWTFISSTIKCK